MNMWKKYLVMKKKKNMRYNILNKYLKSKEITLIVNIFNLMKQNIRKKKKLSNILSYYRRNKNSKLLSKIFIALHRNATDRIRDNTAKLYTKVQLL